MTFWSDIETRREELGLSRAEMCRRAGVSESTVFKGLQRGSRPSSSVRKILNLVLEAADVTGDVRDKVGAHDGHA